MEIYNLLILILHASVTGLLSLVFLRLGKEYLTSYLCLLAVLMNLFVLKQITFFGLTVTCSDALAVGYLLGLNLIQEFFSRSLAKKVVWIGLSMALVFLFLSEIHLIYHPSAIDDMHPHYEALLKPQFRLIFASLITFFIIQFFDIRLFSLLRKQIGNKWFSLRTMISLLLAETFDTTLFSFLGLYGMVESLPDIIFFSLLAKWIVIFFSLPFTLLAKRSYVSL